MIRGRDSRENCRRVGIGVCKFACLLSNDGK